MPERTSVLSSLIRSDPQLALRWKAGFHKFMTIDAASRVASSTIEVSLMRKFMMNSRLMLRKIIVVVAIASALGGSVLPTSAFARGSTFGDGRVASGANVDRNHRVP
jgi:hypothetical protein